MPVLETERLRIRCFTPGDWAALQGLILWFNATPFAAYDRTWPTSPHRIKDICRHFSSSDSFMAVCLKDDGRFIGYICLNPTEEGKRTQPRLLLPRRLPWLRLRLRELPRRPRRGLRRRADRENCHGNGARTTSRPAGCWSGSACASYTARSARFGRTKKETPIAFTGNIYELQNTDWPRAGKAKIQ